MAVFSCVLIIAQYPTMHVVIIDMNIFVCVLYNPLIIKSRLRECIHYHVLTEKKSFFLLIHNLKKNKLFIIILITYIEIKKIKFHPLPDLARRINLFNSPMAND